VLQWEPRAFPPHQVVGFEKPLTPAGFEKADVIYFTIFPI
jgi:hypothetical protein